MPASSYRNVLVLLLSVALIASAAVVGVGFGQQTDAGNDDSAELTTQSTSYLRIAHAAPGAGEVDVYVDNASVASGVPFGAVSDYLALDAGTHNVTVTVVGVRDAVVFEETVDLEPRTTTTVAATMDTEADGAVTPVAYADDARTPADNESALRIVHLSPNAPAVDVVAVASDDAGTDNETEAEDTETETEAEDTETETEAEDTETETEAEDTETETEAEDTETETEAENTTDEEMETGADEATATETVLAENVSYTNATDYLTVPAGNYTVEVRVATADNDGPAVATVDVNLTAGTAYSAWAIGNVPENGTEVPPTFRVVATQDASQTFVFPAGTPGTPAPPTETPTENVTETPSENVTETPSENVTETPTENVTETPSENVTETATEEATETATEAGTETATEAGTETATEAGTGTATEAGTGTATEAGTETATEAATETVTEEETETAT